MFQRHPSSIMVLLDASRKFGPSRSFRRMIALTMTVVMVVAVATTTFARGVVSPSEAVSVERDLGNIENLRLISGSIKIEISHTPRSAVGSGEEEQPAVHIASVRL